MPDIPDLIIGLCVVAVALTAVLCVRVSRPHTGHRVRDDRYQGHHTPEAVVQQQWAADAAEHDYIRWDHCDTCYAAFERVNGPGLRRPATPDVRSAWEQNPRRTLTVDRPPWDTAGFPAIPRTVHTVTLPPLPEFRDQRWSGERGICDHCGHLHIPDAAPYGCAHFPGPSDSPARDAGAERLAVSSTTGGEPSTDLPGPAQATAMSPDQATSSGSRAGEPSTDLPGPAGARVTTASESSDAVTPTAGSDGSLYPLEMARAAVVRAGEPDREIPVGPRGSWRRPDTSQLAERGVEAPSDHLPGPAANRDSGSREPVQVGADGRAGEPTLRRILTFLRDRLIWWTSWTFWDWRTSWLRPWQRRAVPWEQVKAELGLETADLPVAVTVPRAPQPPLCAGPDSDGESVLEGVVHATRPPAADYDYDTLVYLAELEAQFTAEHIALRAWSRQLEGAAT